MKIAVQKNYEVEEVGAGFSSIEAGIDMENLGYIFDIVSTQMYKDPIGSIVRELTSNGYDSHIEAKVNKPVIVSRGKDESGTYISFEDFGKGMSMRRIKKIYMKYFSSTKRGNNDEIGGFGLGSKSPLSYTDMFFVRSRYRGIECEYMLHKGEKFPALDLITRQDTTESNGVEIKIYLKSTGHYDFAQGTDDWKFQSKIKEQLCYFDGVFTQNWGVINDYEIFEGKNFKYRPDNPFGAMHICLGKVYYPIDWNEIDIFSIACPVAIKFNIGELIVTPNRESLRYTDEVKELVKQRIEAACEEIRSIYAKQLPEITDYMQWLKMKDKQPFVKFGEHTLVVSGIPDVHNNIPFKPFKDLGIDVKTDSPFPEYFCDERVSYKGSKEATIFPTRETLLGLLRNASPCIMTEGATNNESNAYLMEQYVENSHSHTIYLIRKKSLTYSEYKKLLGFHKYTFGNGHAPDIDIAKKIRAYQMIMKEQVLTLTSRTLIRDGFLTYKSIQPSEEWIKEWKLRVKMSSAAYHRKMNQLVLYKDMTNYAKGNSVEIKFAELDKHTSVLIYGNSADKNELWRVGDLIRFRKTLRDKSNNHRVYIDNKKARVIMTAQSNNILLQENIHNCYVKDFYSNNKLFVELATAFKVKKLLEGIKNIEEYEDISVFVYERLVILRELTDKYVWNQRSEVTGKYLTEYEEDVMKLAQARGLWDKSVLKTIEEIELWFLGVEHIKFTVLNSQSKPYIVDVLKRAKKKINSFWYYNPDRKSNEGTQGVLEGEGERYDFLQVTYLPNYFTKQKEELLWELQNQKQRA